MTRNFRYCYKFLSFIGVHPRYKLYRPLIFGNYLAVLCIFILVLLKLYMKADLDSIESCNILFLVSLKYAVLIFRRDLIKQALNDIDNFWKDESNDSQINTLTKYLSTGGKLYVRYLCFGLAASAVKPFTSSESSIFGCYIPPQIPFPVFYFLELYVFLFAVITYAGFNMLICSCIILGVLQFRLLSVRIKALNLRGAVESNYNLKICLRNLKKKVEYHNFLIKYAVNLNKILSLPICLLIMMSVSLLCIYMYVLSTTEAIKIDCIRIGVNSFSMISEFLCIYGLPAQLLMDEAAEISNTVYYECEWYLPNIVPVRKYILMMMLRSQREVRISAEGFVTINNQTVVMMLKTAYSFYTFLQTLT